MEQLITLLKDIRPDVDFLTETKLFDDGILDSFDIITVVSEMNHAFDVSINVADLVPENMNSAEAMWQLVTRLKK